MKLSETKGSLELSNSEYQKFKGKLIKKITLEEFEEEGFFSHFYHNKNLLDILLISPSYFFEEEITLRPLFIREKIPKIVIDRFFLIIDEKRKDKEEEIIQKYGSLGNFINNEEREKKENFSFTELIEDEIEFLGKKKKRKKSKFTSNQNLIYLGEDNEKRKEFNKKIDLFIKSIKKKGSKLKKGRKEVPKKVREDEGSENSELIIISKDNISNPSKKKKNDFSIYSFNYIIPGKGQIKKKDYPNFDFESDVLQEEDDSFSSKLFP